MTNALDQMSPEAQAALMLEKTRNLQRRVKSNPTLLRQSSYFRFQERYRDDALGFAHDCIGWKEEQEPTFYQDSALAAWGDYNRLAIRGPHGLGKTALVSWNILWFALTRDGDDWLIPTTASVTRQLTKYLWPEIHKWARVLRWDVIGRGAFDNRTELQLQTLRLATGQAYAMASDNHEALEGAHADCILYVFDESKAIKDETFDAAEGAFASGAGQEVKVLAVSTPGESAGRFYDIHKRKAGLEDWRPVHVTMEDTIKAGRMTREWAAQRAKQWGETSSLYKRRVRGEFAADDVDGIIPLAWVEAAVRLWQDMADDSAGFHKGEFWALGADIGLGGENSDRTVFARMYRTEYQDATVLYFPELETQPRGDVDTATMQTANHLMRIHNAYGGKERRPFSYIDSIGIGAGVYHRLREEGYRAARAFNASEKTRRTDQTKEMRFANKRTAGWWLFREMLDPNADTLVALPPNESLIGELTTTRYKELAGGIILAESKLDIRKRLGRSTDNADPTIQAATGDLLALRPKARVYIPGTGFID
jgi:hypothetical protein